MPRRPKKSRWQPGESGNPAGRRVGSTNQINNEIKDAFAMLLQSQIPNLQDWLNRAAAKDPIKALDLFTRISERFVPSLQRVDHEISGNVQMPINILMPNPTINLPYMPGQMIGEGTPAEIRESYTLPSEQKSNNLEVGEGAATDPELVSISGEGAPTDGVFSLNLPRFAPTDQMLRETGADTMDTGKV